MLLSLRKNDLTSLFKEVRVVKVWLDDRGTGQWKWMQGRSAPHLARTPCVPLFSTLFNRGGNRRAFRLPGAGGGSFPLCSRTSAGSYKAKSGNLNLFLRILPFFSLIFPAFCEEKRAKCAEKRFRLPDFALYSVSMNDWNPEKESPGQTWEVWGGLECCEGCQSEVSSESWFLWDAVLPSTGFVLSAMLHVAFASGGYLAAAMHSA